jgi:hypothetical protein
MYEAYLRQVDGRALHPGWAYADPAEMLSRTAAVELARGNLDIDSYRPTDQRAARLLRRVFTRPNRRTHPMCEHCRRRTYPTELDAYAAALRVSRRIGLRLRVVACPHGAGWHATIHTTTRRRT